MRDVTTLFELLYRVVAYTSTDTQRQIILLHLWTCARRALIFIQFYINIINIYYTSIPNVILKLLWMFAIIKPNATYMSTHVHLFTLEHLLHFYIEDTLHL